MFELRDITKPYPGLRPFESWETEIFFGRKAHTERLLEILRRERFLAVIGPSGSGKSSLVRAGLLPELPRGRLGTGTRWRIATMRPGNEPIRRLARALLQPEGLGEALLRAEDIPPTPDAQTLEVALLEAELRGGQFGLRELAARAAQRQASADADKGVHRSPLNLLVLVDQFEELFTHLDAGTGDPQARQLLAEESDVFVNLLLAARSDPHARVFVVLTMRTDFLGACVRFGDLPDAINRAQYLTPRLRSEEIALAITGPARHFGGDIDPVVVQELINAVGTDPDQLPLLQHALSRMWVSADERAGASDAPCINLRDLVTSGGVRDALSDHAESVLAALCGMETVQEPLAPQQVLARELFTAITEQRSVDSGGQTVRRPQTLALVAAWTQREPQAYFEVVGAFADDAVNFLTYQQGQLGPGTVIDISHEALIRQWGRLRQWVADEARRSNEYRRLRRQSSEFASGEVGSALLGGAGLARAVEWLNGRDGADATQWRPTPAWAARYARAATQEEAQAEFECVAAFIRQSAMAAAAAEQRAAQEIERQRLAEKAEIERQGTVALLAEQKLRLAEQKLRTETEQHRTREAQESAQRHSRQNRWLIVVVLIALGLFGYSLQLRSEAEKKRDAFEEQATVLKGQALWLPLGIETGQLSAKDGDALLRVLRADRGDLAAFEKRLLGEELFADRFLKAPAPLLATMVGPSPEGRRKLLALIDGTPLPNAKEGAARLLSRALIRAALAEPGVPDKTLAAELANAGLGYVSESAESWRIFGRALDALVPYMPAARRRAVFEALRDGESRPSITPAQSLSLCFAMAVMRRYASDSEVAQVFERLFRSSLQTVDAEQRRDAAAARPDVADGDNELPASGLRRDALRLMLHRMAVRIPQDEAFKRWQMVWNELHPGRLAKADAESGAAAIGAGVAPTAAGRDQDAGKRALERADLAQLSLLLARRLKQEPGFQAYEETLRLLAGELESRGASAMGGRGEAAQVLRAHGEAARHLSSHVPESRVAADAMALLQWAASTGDNEELREVFLSVLKLHLRRMTDRQALDFARALAKSRLAKEDARPLWDLLEHTLPRSALSMVPRAKPPDRRVPDELPAPAADKRKPPPPVDLRRPPDAVLLLIAGTTDEETLDSLGFALKSGVERAPAEQLQALGSRMYEQALASGDFDQRRALIQGLRAAATRLDGESADALRKRIAKDFDSDQASSISSDLWPTYLSLLQLVPDREREGAAIELLGLMEKSRVPLSAAASALRQALPQLDDTQRLNMAIAAAAAIGRLQETEAQLVSASRLSLGFRLNVGRRDTTLTTKISTFENLVKACAGELKPDARQLLRVAIIDATLASKTPVAAVSLGRLLQGAADADEDERRRAIGQAMAALPRATRMQDVNAFASAALALLAKQAPSDDVARDMFEIMKYPDIARRAVDAVRSKYASAPPETSGFVAFIAWAQKAWPTLPLDRRAPA